MAWFNKLFNANTFGAAASGFLQGYGNALPGKFAREDRLAERSKAQDFQRESGTLSAGRQAAAGASNLSELNPLEGVIDDSLINTNIARIEGEQFGVDTNLMQEGEALQARLASLTQKSSADTSLEELTKAREELSQYSVSASRLRQERGGLAIGSLGLPDLSKFDKQLTNLLPQVALASAEVPELRKMAEAFTVSGDTIGLTAVNEALRDKFGASTLLGEIRMGTAQRMDAGRRASNAVVNQDFEGAFEIAAEAYANEAFTLAQLNDIENIFHNQGIKTAEGRVAANMLTNTPSSLHMAGMDISQIQDAFSQEQARARLDAQGLSLMVERDREFQAQSLGLAMKLWTDIAPSLESAIGTELRVLGQSMDIASLGMAVTSENVTAQSAALPAEVNEMLKKVRLHLLDDDASMSDFLEQLDKSQSILMQSGAYETRLFRTQVLPAQGDNNNVYNIVNVLLPYGDEADQELERMSITGMILPNEYREAKRILNDPEMMQRRQLAQMERTDDKVGQFIADARKAMATGESGREYAHALDIARQNEDNGYFPKGTVAALVQQLVLEELPENPQPNIQPQAQAPAPVQPTAPSRVSQTFASPAGRGVSPGVGEAIRRIAAPTLRAGQGVRQAAKQGVRDIGTAARRVGNTLQSGARYMTDREFFEARNKANSRTGSSLRR